MGSQIIEAPNDQDITMIAAAWLHADGTCQELVGERLDGAIGDLPRIQRVLDSGLIDRSATYTLQCLGIAFGKVFVQDNRGYDWWMVHDEEGRAVAVRYRQSTLLTFPKTIISKRIEDGEHVDIQKLYNQLQSRLEQMVAEGYGDT